MVNYNSVYSQQKRRREAQMTKTKSEEKLEQPNFFDSTRFRHSIECLHKTPQMLTLSVRQNALLFEHSLTKGKLPAGYNKKTIPLPNYTIVDISEDSIEERKICVEFLQSKEGRKIYKEINGLVLPNNGVDIKAKLAQSLAEMQDDDYLRLTILSDTFTKVQLDSALQNNQSIDLTYFSVVKDPSQLHEKSFASMQLQSYYQAINTQLITRKPSKENTLKLAFLEIHQERLAAIRAYLYRKSITFYGEVLAHQADNNKIEIYDQLHNIFESLPVIQQGRLVGVQRSVSKLISQIDTISSAIDNDAQYPSTYHAFHNLINLNEPKSLQPNHITSTHIALKGISPQQLQKFRINSEQLKILFEKTLQHYHLLSAQPDDNKWSVEIKKEISSINVSAENKVLELPSDIHRRLDEVMPLGALPVIDHEMTHIFQHENGEKIGLGISQKALTARGHLWFEAGAVLSEITSQEELFGRYEPTNIGYLLALKKRVLGGTMSECAKEFYTWLTKALPGEDEDILREVAINRTLRLFRFGGEWTHHTAYWSNSEPLVYGQARVLAAAVPKNLHYLFYIGRLNLHALAELYHLGFIRKSEYFVPPSLPSLTVIPTIQSWIQEKSN